MITVRQLAQEIIRLENSIEPAVTTQYNEQYIMRLVRQAANTFLQPMVFGNMANDDRGSLPMLIVGYEVSVQGEDTHKYITLPEFFQQLLFNKGLKGIAPIEEPTNEWIPRQQPGVSHNLACADAEQQPTYWQEGLRVYFDKEIDLGKVLVKLVVAAPDSVLPDAPLPLYAEMQAPIIQLVRQMMQNRRPLEDNKVLE